MGKFEYLNGPFGKIYLDAWRKAFPTQLGDDATSEQIRDLDRSEILLNSALKEADEDDELKTKALLQLSSFYNARKNHEKIAKKTVRKTACLSLERCKGIQILQISKIPAKCVFSRYRSCPYSRERPL